MNNELVASRSVPYWRERITERWQESVQAIMGFPQNSEKIVR